MTVPQKYQNEKVIENFLLNKLFAVNDNYIHKQSQNPSKNYSMLSERKK